MGLKPTAGDNCYAADSAVIEWAPLNTYNENLAQGIIIESKCPVGDTGLVLLAMCCFQCEL